MLIYRPVYIAFANGTMKLVRKCHVLRKSGFEFFFGKFPV